MLSALEMSSLRKRVLMSGMCWQHSTVTKNFSNIKKDEDKNHYKTLGLAESCTHEDIKLAFLGKSKELHPDKNPQNPETHKHFVAANEAYSVLSKQASRSAYDSYLANRRRVSKHYNTGSGMTTAHPSNERVVFHDESIYEHRNRSQDYKYENRSYYGIKGVKRMPNVYIAGGCVVFLIVGAIFHYFLTTISASFALKQLEKKDFMASQNYIMARSRAKQNGTEKQIELLLLSDKRSMLEDE